MIEVLNNMLKMKPTERLSSAQALDCAWYTRDITDEVVLDDLIYKSTPKSTLSAGVSAIAPSSQEDDAPVGHVKLVHLQLEHRYVIFEHL